MHAIALEPIADDFGLVAGGHKAPKATKPAMNAQALSFAIVLCKSNIESDSMSERLATAYRFRS